jgi:spore germination cell wall hydrolase CwlJ-like protein
MRFKKAHYLLRRTKMKKMISIILSIIALAVLAPCHAKEVGKQSDLECLARNIYYEAASEPEEGKVAVGLVTINRSNSGEFPTTICGVVNQRTVFSVPHSITKVHTYTEGKVFKKTVEVKETVTTWSSHAICQFSWRCENVRAIRKNDDSWDASLAVAQELLDGGYQEFRYKYQDALYFHERHIRPTWAKQKRLIERIGGHIFYADRTHIRDDGILTSYNSAVQ